MGGQVFFGAKAILNLSNTQRINRGVIGYTANYHCLSDVRRRYTDWFQENAISFLFGHGLCGEAPLSRQPTVSQVGFKSFTFIFN